jgi:hypothetical protein
MLTAIPGEFPVRATSAPPPLAETRVAPPETFAPVCRSGEVDAGRPQPAWLRQSFIGDTCEAPPLPAAIDGYTASREEIVAGMEAVKKYQVAAEAFEACVGKFIAAQAQNKDRPMSRSETAIQNYRIIVSQRARAAAKLRMESSIIAFNEYGSTCPE